MRMMDETHGAALPDADDRGAASDDGEITIYIDRSAFRVRRRALTGGALRTLATPAIGGEYELYHVSPGGEQDRLVHDEEVVELEDGGQFFSAPKMILAGDGSGALSYAAPDVRVQSSRRPLMARMEPLMELSRPHSSG
jgi:hypothetical protein